MKIGGWTLQVSVCLRARPHWPRQTIRILIVILVIAAAGRWAPAEVLPLILGAGLGALLLASVPAGLAVAP
jgi:hypothetical protein